MLTFALKVCGLGSLAFAIAIGFHTAHCQESAESIGTRLSESDARLLGVDPDELSKATVALQALVDSQKTAGAVIMVSRRGKLVLADAVGLARVDSKQPMQLDSVFRIYSMSKAVTSVAVMQLVERGQVELDAPISKYLPELESLRVDSPSEAGERKVAVQVPSVRDLLRHTSGLTYGLFGDTPVDRLYRGAGILGRNDSNETLVKKLAKLPLLYAPSKRFEYSVSTDVLGRLVEVVSGKPLDAYFSNSIFIPLGMTDTGFFVPEAKKDRFVDNFGPNGEGGLRAIELAEASQFLRNPPFLSGGGGLVSTAPDYMRFCQMLCGLGTYHGVRLLKEDTVREMTRDQLPEIAFPISINGDKRVGVGFGLGFSVVVESIPGFEYVPNGEYGWGGAASTHFWISPKHELAVVVLSQLMPFNLQCESAVKPLVYNALNE